MNISIEKQRHNAVVSDFKEMVYEQGINKSVALDILCEKYKGEVNQPWLRGQFFTCGAWKH